MGVRRDHWPLAGLKWTFKDQDSPTYLCDTRLPFGARLSVESFHRLSMSIQRILNKQGIKNVIYLDDILLVSPTKQQCEIALSTTIAVLRSLGFAIAYNKIMGPSQSLTFLGITIDTVACTLSLPNDRVTQFHSLLQQFATQKRASQKQLQKLAGKMQWASHVVRGGRIYLQRVLDTLRPLKSSSHKAKLSSEFKADIAWWLNCLPSFNGVPFNFTHSHSHVITTDSSQTGAGAVLDDVDWFYVDWRLDVPAVQQAHINIKETLAVAYAIYRWAPYLHNSSITIFTDNICTKAALNKGACRNPAIMTHIRNIFWLSNYYKFDLKCIHLPGRDNLVCDALSRLRQSGHLMFWFSIMCKNQPFNLETFLSLCYGRMSPKVMSFFSSQIPRIIPWWKSSTEV